MKDAAVGCLVRVVFTDEELDVDECPTFSLEPFFDVFVFGSDVFVSNKGRFESVRAYRAGHVMAFQDLMAEPDFASIFSDVAAITAFVGANKIHLRRAIAIRERGHFCDARLKPARELRRQTQHRT